MLLLPCQQTMLLSRRDFTGGVRVYICELSKVAFTVSGPGSDEETVEMVCEECCEMKNTLGPS